MVSKKVLIGFISRWGSTKAVAERIQKNLLDRNIPCDVLPLPQIVNIEPYLSLVVGAPVHALKWHPTAVDFLLSHQHQFRNRVLALFACSYLVKVARPGLQKKLQELFSRDRQLPKPDLSAVFGGRLPRPLPFFARLTLGVPKEAPLDTLAWEEVDIWAEQLAQRVEQKAEYLARVLRGGYD